jgi:hypothetical protein
MVDKVQVIVPGPDFRMGPRETVFWDYFGLLFDRASEVVGPEIALSIMLSRASRELRRRVGIEEAKLVFLECARTMDAAAENDR